MRRTRFLANAVVTTKAKRFLTRRRDDADPFSLGLRGTGLDRNCKAASWGLDASSIVVTPRVSSGLNSLFIAARPRLASTSPAGRRRVGYGAHGSSIAYWPRALVSGSERERKRGVSPAIVICSWWLVPRTGAGPGRRHCIYLQEKTREWMYSSNQVWCYGLRIEMCIVCLCGAMSFQYIYSLDGRFHFRCSWHKSKRTK
jgi:hypothetical protein